MASDNYRLLLQVGNEYLLKTQKEAEMLKGKGRQLRDSLCEDELRKLYGGRSPPEKDAFPGMTLVKNMSMLFARGSINGSIKEVVLCGVKDCHEDPRPCSLWCSTHDAVMGSLELENIPLSDVGPPTPSSQVGSMPFRSYQPSAPPPTPQTPSTSTSRLPEKRRSINTLPGLIQAAPTTDLPKKPRKNL